jgi:hypothetical protein
VTQVLQSKKGFLSALVRAGLIATLVASVSACDQQITPADAAPTHLAETTPSQDTNDIPTVVVTARKERKGAG